MASMQMRLPITLAGNIHAGFDEHGAEPRCPPGLATLLIQKGAMGCLLFQMATARSL